jgi:hypothetical protein
MGIKLSAVRDGLELRGVEVEVETECDDRALFGIGSAGAAPIETRVSITLDTDAADDVVQALVQRALELDIWFLVLRDAQRVRTRVRTRGAEAAPPTLAETARP